MDLLRYIFKSYLFILLAAVFITACTLISDSFTDLGPVNGTPKGRNPHPADIHNPYGGLDSALLKNAHLYYTAVEFPPDYHWQQDSAYGRAEAWISLYRDKECLQRIKCSEKLTYDADLHHFIDGHLYTECVCGSSTVICCDGNELLVIPERVRLCGLVERDGVIYTLSRPVDGQGFCLRRGQDVILRNDAGVPFGSFQNASYPESGALYIDAFRLVFSYAYGNELHIVIDGMDGVQEHVTGPFVDCKLYRSRPYRMFKSEDGIVWHRGSAWAGDSFYASSGVRYLPGGATGSCVYEFLYHTVNDFGPPDTFTYVSSLGMAGVRYCKDGIRAVFLPFDLIAAASVPQHDAFAEGDDRSIEGSFRFISERCVILRGDELVLAVSGNSRGECPRIICGSKSHVLNINGFISSISISDE